MKYTLILFLLFISSPAFSQGYDSLLLFKIDSGLYKTNVLADSVDRFLRSQTENLNLEYQKRITDFVSLRDRLQSTIDSLHYVKLPVGNLTTKIDSLNHLIEKQTNWVTTKTEILKSKVSQRVTELQLPPPLEEPLQKLKSSIDHIQISSPTHLVSMMPGVEIPALKNLHLQTLSNQLTDRNSFGAITSNLESIKELTGKAEFYKQDGLKHLTGDLTKFKDMDNLMEGKLLAVEGVGQLKEGSALIHQMEQFDSAALTEKANKMVEQVVTKKAKDHFAGKQEVLSMAMDKMAVLKGKYKELPNMAQLPKRAPNPFKGKPFIERVMPTVTFQIQKSDYLLLDINPMLMYRISPRISAGAGWNYRLSLSQWSINNEGKVFGPRVALEVLWIKGMSFRLLPEIMNTSIPKMIAQAKGVDTSYREWVGSLFIGVKKSYTICKQMKGNSEVLYNLYDPDGLSPYQDRVSLRFGFEFPWSKKYQR